MSSKNLGWALAILLTASQSFGSSQVRLPSGTVLSTARTSCPVGTLAANGASVLRAGLYSELFTAIGTTYGSVDGTHFTVPDMRGVFPRGAGSQTIGPVTYTGTQGTVQGDQEQGHYHSLTDPGHTHSLNNSALISGNTNAPTAVTPGSAGQNITATIGTSTTGITIQSPTSDGSNGTPRVGTETRPANVTVLYCVWY